MGCSLSSCAGWFSLPFIFVGIGVVIYVLCRHFEKMDALESFVTSIVDNVVLKKLLTLFNFLMGCNIFLQFLNTWVSLERGIALTPDLPYGFLGFGKRCVPLFDAVTEFNVSQKNSNTSALFAYEKQGKTVLFDANVRLCSDAPPSVVSSFFVARNFTVLPTLPVFPGCTFEEVALNCKTVNYDNSADRQSIPTCAKLLQTLPLPNGFLYKTTNGFFSNSPPPVLPNCDVEFQVQNKLPACSYKHVYRIEKIIDLGPVRIAGIFTSIPLTAYVIGVLILFRRWSKKSNDEEMTQEDQEAYSFALETPAGQLFGSICECAQDYQPPLTGFCFFCALAVQIVELVTISIQMMGCCICNYVEIYYLLWLKILSILFLCKFFFRYKPKTQVEIGSLIRKTPDTA
jgi:hypothetical protein